MVRFLVIISKLTPFSKRNIDDGDTPQDIYNLCVGIREAFCISYNIRKENDFYLYIVETCTLISFTGRELRYLGPDERSQVLLLLKALNLKVLVDNDKIKSTPGIYVRKFRNIQDFIDNLMNSELEHIFILENTSPFSLPFLYHMQGYPKIKKLSQIKDLKDKIVIVPAEPLDNKVLIDILKIITENNTSELKYIKLTTLNKVNNLGDKILYVNYQIDRQEMNKK